MRWVWCRSLLLFVPLTILVPQGVGAAVFNFESYADGDPVGELYPGIILTNATAIVAGASLNEAEFPPRSGNTVVFDDGGPISIDFSTPVASVSAWFTYASSLTLYAYDAVLNLLATDVSLFASNLALTGEAGSTPNERLSVASAIGISRVTIGGDPAGGSFAMDDLSLESRSADVSEPPVAALLMLGTLLLGRARAGLRRLSRGLCTRETFNRRSDHRAPHPTR